MSRSALSTVRHSFRSAALQYRSYFVPTHILTYWKILREHAVPPETGRKLALFDFTRAEVDNVSGRYLFALVRDFEALGFLPCYRKNFRFLATMQHKLFKRLLLKRPFSLFDSADELPPDSIAVEVTDRPQATEDPGRRRIRVRYEEAWPRSDREVAMTFFVHPILYDDWLASLEVDLTADRPWRMFFGGKWSKKYEQSTLPDKFGKMSRRQILDTLASRLPADCINTINSSADLEAPTARPAFTWVDPERFRIPWSKWIHMMTRADFFLACPGIDMPLCHSLVESLVRGTVPILEHPEYLDPPLEHNVNCLVFHGPDELMNTVHRVLQLSPVEILRLRRGAFAYHERHLAPGAFARRLISGPHPTVDLLLNAYRAPRSPVRDAPRHEAREPIAR